MLRKREKRLVVTFHTTADAMAMEKACREQNVPGRLIPAPGSISAGCGMAWCASPEDRERVLQVLSDRGIEKEAVQECMLWV